MHSTKKQGGCWLYDLAHGVEGQIEGNAQLWLCGVASLEQAQSNEISFLIDPSHQHKLTTTQAGALMLGPTLQGPPAIPILRVADPRQALPKLLEFFAPSPQLVPGIAPEAWVSPTATVSPDARIEPFAYVGEGAIIEQGAWLYPFVYVGRFAYVGPEAVLYPGAVLMDSCCLEARVVLHPGAVVGAPGFGVIPTPQGPLRLPQIGRTMIGANSQVGANSTVDRAMVGETRLHHDVHLDNLVQIGHHCQIGPRTLIAGQAGIAGSTVVGADVQIGGQAGIGDHLRIEQGARIAGGSGVIRDVAAGESVAGYPALPRYTWLRLWSLLLRFVRKPKETSTPP